MYKGMQFHPFSVTSLVCSGKGGSAGGSEELKEKREESWPLINLQLDVGGGLAFTDAQFHELFLQVVIFKYLNSGLSVPFHLFLPFRKSLANSSSDCGFSPPLLLVHGSTMDLEPGRCRRTDGKKWRCYGNVIPDQKYCERHMFRGSSQRSRKLVEASRNILKSKNDNRENLLPSDKKSRTTAAVSIPNGSFSVPVSTTLNLTPPSVIAADAGKNNSRDESKQNDSSGNRNPRKSSVAAGVSPKSVLQGGGTGTDNGNLSFDTEELRCRRTDGKRWRCSKMVVPSKKYCENHMHRGAKKSASGSTAAAVTVVASGSCMRKSEMVKKSCRVLDTNLSISVAVNPWQVFDGDSTTTSSSSSDATTVSDENVYQFLNTF